jgi:2-polyprenyl-6-methoxyphenol hydroxylase-like FAD-dependent oxidoreductase
MSTITTTLDQTPQAKVLIVGAGPVGLFLGLKIAQQGIKTIVIDKEAEIIKSPRATAYRSIVHSNLVTFPSS